MVYGGLRYGGSVYLRRYVCERPGNGYVHEHDLHTDLSGIHHWLFRYRLLTSAGLLQAEYHNDIHISATSVGTESLQNGGLVLPVVEDDGRGRAFLCRLFHTPTLRIRISWSAVCSYRGMYGGSDLALYTARRHQNAGLDRHVPDHLYVPRPTPYYI